MALTKLFLQELMRPRGVKNLTLSDATKELLANAQWRGNVRELQSVVQTGFERCVAEGANTLDTEHFALELEHLAPKQTARDSGEAPPQRTPPEKDSEEIFREESIADLRSSVRVPISTGWIMDDRDALKAFLDQIRGPSGLWNISVAHRLLEERGEIDIGRRAFAKRVRRMFPNQE